MTPSIEERREVAEGLRAMCAHGCRYAEQFYELLNETVMDEWDFHGFQDMADRLADLIEPSPERTCRNIGGDKWEFMCSECGGHTHGSPFHIPDAERDELARALGGRIASLHGSVPRFCPNCGAKVVEP